MKKLLTIILITILTTSAIPVHAADNSIISSEVVYLTDDLYMEIVLTESSSDISTCAMQTKSVTKTANLKNDSGNTVATFKLNATFIYDGSSSSCTAVSHNTSISNDAWEFDEASSTKLGSVASGSFTLKKYVLFVCTQTVSDSLTIKCDVNGNIS